MRMNTEPKSHYQFRLNFWKIRGSHRRRSTYSGTRVGLGALGVGALAFITLVAFSSDTALAATTLNLGSAASYAVVAGSTITNTGASVITGSVGLFPGTVISGFPPGTVSGATNAANAASLSAQSASTAAYLVAAGDTPTASVAGGILGGTTLTPGVYHAPTMSLTGALTLNGGGDSSAVFIIQSDSTLITASNSSVVLEGHAQACNVFWQVGSSATLGTATTFMGTILALTSVALNTGASVVGRVMAQTGAVTLDDNAITLPSIGTVCATPPATTTTTVPATTTTTVPATTTTTIPATTTTTVPATTATTKVAGTILPVGAPGTGEGGTGGSGSSLLGLIGFGAFGVAAAAASVAVRSRHQRGRDSSSGLTRGS